MFNKIFFNILLGLTVYTLVKYIFFTDYSGVYVRSTSGTIRGQTIRVLNKTVYQFLGIPYAEPPIGELRFARPVPIKIPRGDIIDGTQLPASCIQERHPFVPELNYTSEDCLYLNIFTPTVDYTRAATKHPVMFWIHGGGHSVGSSDMYNGTALATEDVVVVTINYRLGKLGFMYSDDKSAPGNQGLYDQLMALKWVHKNIQYFGGDPNQITLFGESAGSWSISAHILSPLSKGLFKRAIMQSGAHMYNKDRDVSTREEALVDNKLMARKLNCTTNNWVQCLRKVGDANEFLPFVTFGYLTYPTLDTEFLPTSAQKAFLDNTYNSDIDIMAGVNAKEGSLIKYLYWPLDEDIDVDIFKHFVKKVDKMFHNLDEQIVADYYLKGVDINNSQSLKWAFYEFYGDVSLKCPTYLFAKHMATRKPVDNSNVYFYELRYQLSSFAQQFGCDEQTMGICHAMELPFVWGKPIVSPDNSDTDTDIEFTKYTMKLWTNFAKYGKPDNHWPKFLSNSKTKVKNLSPNNLQQILDNPYYESCDVFWKNYY